MSDSSSQITSSDVGREVEELVRALEHEYEQMSALNGRLEDKLEALRNRNGEALESTTVDLSQTIRELDGLSAERTRRMSALAEVLELERPTGDLAVLADRARALGLEEEAERLAQWRSTLQEEAERAQQLCEQVAFGLQYAAAIGQEMLEVLRGGTQDTPTSTYSANGRTDADSSNPSFVNRLG